jgi:hypothetical protein
VVANCGESSESSSAPVNVAAESCEKIPITKCLLERRKCRSSGTVAGCNLVDFEFIVGYDVLNQLTVNIHGICHPGALMSG